MGNLQRRLRISGSPLELLAADRIDVLESPVLPDDVKEAVDHLRARTVKRTLTHCDDAADLIERQNLALSLGHKNYEQLKERLQWMDKNFDMTSKRIEELEKQTLSLTSRLIEMKDDAND